MKTSAPIEKKKIMTRIDKSSKRIKHVLNMRGLLLFQGPQGGRGPKGDRGEAGGAVSSLEF